jgi:hypothetical protein
VFAQKNNMWINVKNSLNFLLIDVLVFIFGHEKDKGGVETLGSPRLSPLVMD